MTSESENVPFCNLSESDLAPTILRQAEHGDLFDDLQTMMEGNLPLTQSGTGLSASNWGVPMDGTPGPFESRLENAMALRTAPRGSVANATGQRTSSPPSFRQWSAVGKSAAFQRV